MRINPRVSVAVSIEMPLPARPVTISNMLMRYRQAMYVANHRERGEEFNPRVDVRCIVAVLEISHPMVFLDTWATFENLHRMIRTAIAHGDARDERRGR